MARITAPNGEQLPDTDNPGLLAYYQRHGYTVQHGDPKPEQPEGEQPEAPAESANKPEWVEYAVACGATEAEAEDMTKADLIAAYGGE